MPFLSIASNVNYVAMVRGVRELHRLSASGTDDDSPEASAVRDATDGPWQALSEPERERVRNLSEDLFSLIEPATVPQPMNSHMQSMLSEAIDARKQGNWDRALALLRQCAAFLSPAHLSFLRGAIWLDAGDPETAVVFFEHAVNLDPDNQHYRTMVLHATELADLTAARQLANETLHDSEH
jgi:tetratricopeptide (TPR) repeat protein